MPVTEQQIDAALADARGTPADRTEVRSALTLMGSHAQVAADSCRVLYAGGLSGAVDGGAGDPQVLALACATTHGNTVFEVDAATSAGLGAYNRTKLTDPHSVLVMPADMSSGEERALVLASPTATVPQLIADGRVSQTVPLTAGVGSLAVGQGQPVQVRALDVAGAVVGSGTGPMGEDIPEEGPPDLGPVIDNWK